MGRSHEEAACSPHSLKGVPYLRRRSLAHQVIGAYLCKDRENVHLSRGRSNRAKDCPHAIDDVAIMSEEIPDGRPEIYLRTDLRVKHGVPDTHLIHIVMRTVNMLEGIVL